MNDEHAVMQDLMVGQASEVLIDVNAIAEPVDLPVDVERRQPLRQASIKTSKVLEELLFRRFAGVTCTVEAKHDLAGFYGVKIILLDAPKMTKLFPHRANMLAWAEG